MGRGKRRWFRARFWGVASGVWVAAFPVHGQGVPRDPLFRFSLDQKFGANDNTRLDPRSVGTTYFSDTTLSFDFNSQTRSQQFDLSLGGVVRLVDDPTVGSKSGFRDPTADLSYVRDVANARFTLQASYARPDLAFLDPLKQVEIGNQDLFQGGGTRADTRVSVGLETGLQAPLGFVLNLDTDQRHFSATTDPTLFDNRTDTVEAGMRFRFSPVLRGRFDYSDRQYEAQDVLLTRTDTRRLTVGLDYDLSPVSALSLEVGHSEVIESFDVLPGVETVTRGFVGSVSLIRQVPDGQASAVLDTVLNQRGRQTTLEFGRVFDLPAGGLEIGVGATQGSNFNARPVGRISYAAELPRGSFDARLSRTVSLSDTLNQTSETTQANLNYRVDVNDLSGLDFTIDYADISSPGTGRKRGSVSATYSRNVTRDWEFRLGYAYRYYNPDTADSSRSNEIFFALQRDFEMFR